MRDVFFLHCLCCAVSKKINGMFTLHFGKLKARWSRDYAETADMNQWLSPREENNPRATIEPAQGTHIDQDKTNTGRFLDFPLLKLLKFPRGCTMFALENMVLSMMGLFCGVCMFFFFYELVK